MDNNKKSSSKSNKNENENDVKLRNNDKETDKDKEMLLTCLNKDRLNDNQDNQTKAYYINYEIKDELVTNYFIKNIHICKSIRVLVIVKKVIAKTLK